MLRALDLCRQLFDLLELDALLMRVAIENLQCRNLIFMRDDELLEGLGLAQKADMKRNILC